MDNTTIINRFNENISYLQTYQKNLFDKLVAFDNAVVNGHYQEKYELIYENGFDVVEKATGKKLYENKSEQYAQEASQSIEYSLDDNVFITGFKNDFTKEDLESCTNFKPFEYNLQGMAPLRYYMQEQAKGKTGLNKLYKFIFFGSGLGLHMESIDKKISSKVYLIVEDDLELFRLSLFVVDYSKLAKHAKLFFSVFEDEQEFSITANLFLQTEYYYNLYIKYFHTLNHSVDKLKQFHLAITSQLHLNFFYNDLLMQKLAPLENLFSDEQFLLQNITFKNTSLENKPFLLLGAGPSLQKNIEWVKEKQNSFVIVALSATLSLLEREKIKPDIIIHLDVFKAAYRHFNKVKNFEWFKDTIYILPAKIDPVITSKFNRKNIFFYENGTEYRVSSFKTYAPCVGSTAYQILLSLEVKNIYLLGLDLAIDAKTGKTHSDSHEYVKTLDTNAADDEKMSFKEHLIEVAGNTEEIVFTTPNFNTSIQSINTSTKQLKTTEQKIYNLSNGAKFFDVKSFDKEEFRHTETFECQQELYEIFLKNSSNSLSEQEYQALESQVSYAQNMQEDINGFSKKKKFSVDELKERLILLSQQLSHNDKSDLKEVYEIYCRYLLPYVFDFLNKKEMKYDKQTLLDIRDIFTKELFHIVDYYTNALENTLSIGFQKANQYKFIASLENTINFEKIKQDENSIGFLYMKENQEDTTFISYIKELSQTIPEITFKVFCFFDIDKKRAELEFESEIKKLEVVLIDNIQTIEKEVEIFIGNQKSRLDLQVAMILRKLKQIIAILFNINEKGYTVASVMERHRKNKHAIYEDPEFFGFSKDELEKWDYSIYKLLYKKYIVNLSDQTDVYRVTYFDAPKLALENEEFRNYLISILHKQALYVKKKAAT
ncbi:motility associated factor glycosyltransferase family protein [Sulfurimonas sp.]|uniref:motility associated factor glycosyltransferase family protein n=1 Tax=Sulfurimonas sp. TaxID=2022749 RepID=UPI003D0AC932